MKISKPCVTGFCVGNSPVNSPRKWPVTRKMFPFGDVIMIGRQPKKQNTSVRAIKNMETHHFGVFLQIKWLIE